MWDPLENSQAVLNGFEAISLVSSRISAELVRSLVAVSTSRDVDLFPR